MAPIGPSGLMVKTIAAIRPEGLIGGFTSEGYGDE